MATRVGYIGLGDMGKAMASNLALSRGWRACRGALGRLHIGARDSRAAAKMPCDEILRPSERELRKGLEQKPRRADEEYDVW